eukprot:m.84721 g.84721  ORF g.84721 m.84721 type:complete len:161 (-) comp25792_c0_seq1:257-739(-)
MTHYNLKFGPDRVAAMLPRMIEVAAAETPSIKLSYGGTVGDTTDSHRLIAWAAKTGGAEAQNSVVESLFKAYFEQEKNIASHDVLVAAAVEANIASEDSIRAFLTSKDMDSEVIADASGLRTDLGVTGVPFFVVDNKFAVSGAQDSDTFVQMFGKIATQN